MDISMGKSVVCVYLQQQEGGTTKCIHSSLLCQAPKSISVGLEGALDLPF